MSLTARVGKLEAEESEQAGIHWENAWLPPSQRVEDGVAWGDLFVRSSEPNAVEVELGRLIEEIHRVVLRGVPDAPGG